MMSRKEKARVRAQEWRDKQPKPERKHKVCGSCSVDITHLHFNSRYCSTACKRLVGREVERNHPDYGERHRARSTRYVANNPEKRKESSRRYRENNLEYYAAKRAQRRAAQLERTPAWLTESDQQDILSMYSFAKKLEDLCGIEYEVDHIVPLQGSNVSGLHVPWNLQILTKRSNRVKGNRYDV